MIDRLEATLKRYNEIGEELANPEIISDIKKMTLLSKERTGLEKTVEVYKEYKKVVMFGVDKKLSECIRFESVAQKDGQVIHTSFDMAPYIHLAAENNIRYCASDIPTKYLCNEAYFCMLRKMSCPVLFVHIPGLAHMSETFFQKLKIIFCEWE